MHESNPSMPIPPGHPGAFACLVSPRGGAFACESLPGGGAFEMMILSFRTNNNTKQHNQTSFKHYQNICQYVMI